MDNPIDERPVQVTAEPGVLLDGILRLPLDPKGVILFAHGSSSGRYSPPNQMVARSLNEAGFATLLMDLLTADEESADLETGNLRFDIELLANRLTGAIDWLTRQNETRPLNIGLFGASTGAGAALVAAARRASLVSAIVSRGGRADLAGDAIPEVQAAALLIVGGDDVETVELNSQVMGRLGGEQQLEIVPGASHLFEEPGALESVIKLAQDWFTTYLVEDNA